MKTQKILIITMLLCLIGLATACENKTAKQDDDNGDGGNPQSGSLFGTHWRLTAFVDVENNTRTEPDYSFFYIIGGDAGWKDSMYTLSFNDSSVINDDRVDSLVTGFSTGNLIFGKYSADYNTGKFSYWKCGFGTQAGEFGCGFEYVAALRLVQSFNLYPQALHLFYNDGKKYLEFNRREQ